MESTVHGLPTLPSTHAHVPPSLPNPDDIFFQEKMLPTLPVLVCGVILAGITAYLVLFYGNYRTTSPFILGTTFAAWFLGLSIIFLIPVDLVSVCPLFS
jgi:hypothetical protein